MGAKLYADTATKTLIISATPDGDGFIDINVQEEVWSDLIIDWQDTLTLRKHTFPLVAIGGQTISAGKLGTTYVLNDPWHMHPYEGDHTLNVNGNLFTELATTHLVAPTIGAFTVTVNRNLSTLVEVVEVANSGLTPSESQALLNIAADIALIQPDVANLLSITTGIESRGLAEHITHDGQGKIILRDPVAMRRWEADAFQDVDKNYPYTGQGMAVVENLVEVAWS